jgi:hypothetical protein
VHLRWSSQPAKNGRLDSGLLKGNSCSLGFPRHEREITAVLLVFSTPSGAELTKKEEVLARLDNLAAAVRTKDPAARDLISEMIQWLSRGLDIGTNRPIRELLFNARGQLDIKRPDGAIKNIEVAIRSVRSWR